MNNKKGHLPVFGIGPALCYPMALLSAGDFPLKFGKQSGYKDFS